MRILVTGASGLLGLNLALRASQSHEVTGVVNTTGIKTDTFEVRQVDLLKPGALESLVADTRPEWIIHCAALANLEACEKDPVSALLLNGALPGLLAELTARSGARLVHISTDAVFDGQRGGYREEDEANPLNSYARSKLVGEQTAAEVNPQAIIARVNFYGWSLSGERSLAEFFYNDLSAGKQVNGFRDVFFCPLLVNDLADTLLSMLEKGLTGTYHVVSPDCISKYDFGVKIAERFGFDPKLVVPTSVKKAGLKAARSPNLTLKVDKVTKDLGSPPAGIDAGINRLFELYQEGYPDKLKALLA